MPNSPESQLQRLMDEREITLDSLSALEYDIKELDDLLAYCCEQAMVRRNFGVRYYLCEECGFKKEPSI